MNNTLIHESNNKQVIGGNAICPNTTLAICYYDINSNLLDSVFSILSLALTNIHILVIDAVSTAKAILDDAINYDSIEVLDLSHISFANPSQLKNYALNYIDSDYVSFINAGWKLNKTSIIDLFNSPINDSINCFCQILKTNISSIGLFAFKTELLKETKYNKAIYSGEDFELILRLLVKDMTSENGLINKEVFYLESDNYSCNLSLSFFDTLAYCLGKYSNIINSLELYDYVSSLYTEIAKANNYEEEFEKMLQNFLRLENNYELGQNIFIAASSYYYNLEGKKAYDLLSKYFWNENNILRTATLTESNMLLFIMAETYLLFTTKEQLQAFINKYPTVKSFKKDYCQIKFALRRIWFNKDLLEPNYLDNLILDKDIPVEMLSVIAKYSTSSNYQLALFEKIYRKLEANKKLDRIYVNKFDCFKTILEKELTNKKIFQRNFSTRKEATTNETILLTYLDLNKDSYTQKETNSSTNTLTLKPKKDLDPRKIAIIFCTNNMDYMKECIFYLKDLIVPKDFSLEILPVLNANSMTEGYNLAMSHTNAKYKLYIHQDSFIIDRNILSKLISCFENDTNIGMLGIFGSSSLDESCKWFNSPTQDNYFNLFQDEILDVLTSVKRTTSNPVNAWAIDGVFIATSVDISWCEDIFNDWHFYDICQCARMRENGYKTAFLPTNEISMLHENTLNKDPDFKYDLYAHRFKNFVLS